MSSLIVCMCAILTRMARGRYLFDGASLGFLHGLRQRAPKFRPQNFKTTLESIEEAGNIHGGSSEKRTRWERDNISSTEETCSHRRLARVRLYFDVGRVRACSPAYQWRLTTSRSFQCPSIDKRGGQSSVATLHEQARSKKLQGQSLRCVISLCRSSRSR
jgi:hypothetical protein